MTFEFIATTTAIAALLLGLGWMFAGTKLFKRWGIEAHADGLLIGRRLATVYIGIAIILFMGRSSPPSDLRAALCSGLLFAMITLAGLGIYEYRLKRANALILISVALEMFLAVGFSWVLFL